MSRKARYECQCTCHEEGSQEVHFEACCDGECGRCGKNVTNIKKHQAEECPQPAPGGRGRGKPKRKKPKP